MYVKSNLKRGRMLKKIPIILLFAILPAVCIAKTPEKPQTITMSAADAVELAGKLMDGGNLDAATDILTKMPSVKDGAVETERWFLMGQISAKRGDYKTAITIYRMILDARPDLARVRFELATVYMKTEQWYRADYHLRMAMAGDDLPEHAKTVMNYYRYVVRQNKNWNVWFNAGIAPDNNINSAVGGEECIMTAFGLFCRQLPEPERAVGYNVSVGGDYEFKLSNQWRWKSDANIYASIYDKSEYDDLMLSIGTGPRFIWTNGDIWTAATASRRWSGWDLYRLSAGAKINMNYDFTRKLSGGLNFQALSNDYDLLGELLNGETYSVNLRLSYAIDGTKSVYVRGGFTRENTTDLIYANNSPSVGAGFYAALPLGFNAQIDANLYWQNFDDVRWVVNRNLEFSQIAERDFNQQYTLTISNNKLSMYNLMPALTVGYTRRDSNIWQREFDKWTLSITFQQRF
jgi:hypothetical protein